MTASESKNKLNSFDLFVKTVRDLKDLDPKILAVFIADSDGMPVHELGLFNTFSKDGGFQLTAFAAEILSALRGIEGDLFTSPFDTFLAENDEYKMLLFDLTESLILGMVSSSKANVGLIRIVVIEQLASIKAAIDALFE